MVPLVSAVLDFLPLAEKALLSATRSCLVLIANQQHPRGTYHFPAATAALRTATAMPPNTHTNTQAPSMMRRAHTAPECIKKKRCGTAAPERDEETLARVCGIPRI